MRWVKNSSGKEDFLLTIAWLTFLLWMGHGIRHLIQPSFPWDWASSLIILPAISGYLYKAHVAKKPTPDKPT